MLDLESAIAQVEIKVSVDGASIRINDEEVGKSPLDAPLFLPPGTHNLVVKREGYHPYQRTFDTQGEETIRLAIDLKSTHVPVVYEPPKLRTGFWVAAGSTVVALGASGVGFIVAASKDSKLKSSVSEYEELPPNTSQITLDEHYEEIGNLQQQRNTFEAIGWVGAGLAVAGAVTSVALGWDYFFAPRPEGDESAATQKTFSLRPTLSGFGGTF